jgi:hypothetical protein
MANFEVDLARWLPLGHHIIDGGPTRLPRTFYNPSINPLFAMVIIWLMFLSLLHLLRMRVHGEIMSRTLFNNITSMM